MHKAKASHILVKTEEEAKSLLLRIQKGESFEKLAQEFSLCPSRKRGGSLGEFGRGQMVKEFEQAVFNAKPAKKTVFRGAENQDDFRAKGQIVGPVRTQFG